MSRHQQVTTCLRTNGPISNRCSCEHCTLGVCSVCGAYEGSLTTDCPGEIVSADRQKEVWETRLDYTDARGWHQGEPEGKRKPNFTRAAGPHTPIIHDPQVLQRLRIVGCTCGWKCPAGEQNPDEAFAMHTAVHNVLSAQPAPLTLVFLPSYAPIHVTPAPGDTINDRPEPIEIPPNSMVTLSSHPPPSNDEDGPGDWTAEASAGQPVASPCGSVSWGDVMTAVNDGVRGERLDVLLRAWRETVAAAAAAAADRVSWVDTTPDHRHARLVDTPARSTTDWPAVDHVATLQHELSQKAIAWVLADRLADDHSAALERAQDAMKGRDPDGQTTELQAEVVRAKASFHQADTRAVACDDEFRQAARKLVEALESKP